MENYLNSQMDGRMARRLHSLEERLSIRSKDHATLKGANKSKISRVAGKCDRDASQTLITEVEGLPDSYCCQGCQDGPKSLQSLSSNCEKGLLVGCVLQTGPFGNHSENPRINWTSFRLQLEYLLGLKVA